MHGVRKFSWWLTLTWIAVAISSIKAAMVSRFPLNFRHNHKPAFRILYQTGDNESDLPECSPMSVCNRVDTYSTPWIERQCRCPGKKICSMSMDPKDGYTVIDNSRQLKLCETTNRLPTCRYFRDVAWTYTTYPDNTTKHTVHCKCPKNSEAYILKHEIYNVPEGFAIVYFLACSPQSKIRCQRKEPCRLFTVKKKADVEEVNTSTLCQCPHGHRCPRHHFDPSVIFSPSTFKEEHIKTYSGYCALDMS